MVKANSVLRAGRADRNLLATLLEVTVVLFVACLLLRACHGRDSAQTEYVTLQWRPETTADNEQRLVPVIGSTLPSVTYHQEIIDAGERSLTAFHGDGRTAFTAVGRYEVDEGQWVLQLQVTADVPFALGADRMTSVRLTHDFSSWCSEGLFGPGVYEFELVGRFPPR